MLKIFACLVMLVDHVGYVFFPGQLWLRVIGRLAFPIFAWYVAVGFSRTRNRPRYLLRLFLWGLAAQVPFAMLFHGARLSSPSSLFSNGTNVMFTFLLALGALWVLAWSRARSPAVRVVAVLAALVAALAAHAANTDYGAYGVAMVVLFHLFGEQPADCDRQMPPTATAAMAAPTVRVLGRWPRRGLLVLSIFLLTLLLLGPMRMHPIQLYCVAAIPLTWLRLPDPRPGRWKHAFYAFYPVHLLVLLLLV
jgi:hypothetical protein